MAAKRLTAGTLLVGGAAALAGYEFILKPWLASRAASGAAPSLFPFSAPVSTPSYVGPSLTPSTGGQYQGSIVDPRVSPGGDVGQLMWRKGYTQQQAQARLDLLKRNTSEILAILAQLRANGGQAAQLAAMAVAERARQQADLANGDQVGAAKWGQAALDHEQMAAGLATNAAAWEGKLATNKTEYTALTGYQLAA